MKEKLFKLFVDMSIRYKLLISYLLLVFIPFFIYFLINNYISSKEIEKQAIYSTKQLMGQTKTYLESKIDLINNTMNMISYNNTVQELIKQNPEKYIDNIGLWDFDLREASKQFFNLQPAGDIIKIRLYINDGVTTIGETESFLNMQKVKVEEWYKKLTSSSLPLHWFPEYYFTEKEKEKYFSAVRKIRNAENLNELIGIIRVDLKKSMLDKILLQTKYTSSSSVVLINKAGEVVSAASSEVYSSLVSYISHQKLHENSLESSWNTITLDNSKSLLGMEQISGTDWKLVQLVPYNDILSLIKKARTQMIIILLLLIAILAFPLSYLFASSVSRRFRELTSHMKEVESGNFDIRILPSSNDEIGRLTRNFNHMLTKIAMLLEEKYRLGQEIKNTELKALQAQINPHFLYNTLDQINWMAIELNANKICSIVKELSKFYKLSLQNGENIVSVKNELEHIEAYVFIQNIRFVNRIKLITDVPDYLFEYKIPKITLQPIVENAILHGILETKSESGTIRISGSMNECIIALVVEDDGIGMTEEKLQSILESNPSNDFHGYGIKNINQKFMLLYGGNYGLSYESTPNSGTKVTIRFPAT